jgi:YidC/Oxa1 family membrane protein insertase
MLAVAVIPSLIWRPQRPSAPPLGADTTAAPSVTAAPEPSPPPVLPRPAAPTAAAGDTVWVESDLYRLAFTTRGARLVRAELKDYRSFAPGDSGAPVQLVPPGRPWLDHRLTAGSDTAAFADWQFTPSDDAVRVDGVASLTFTAARGAAQVAVEYRFAAGDYRIGVHGAVAGLGPSGAVLTVDLGDGLRSVEADSNDDHRNFAVVTKRARTESYAFRSFDPGEVRAIEGPFEWVAVKSKYFLVAALAIEEGQPPFGGVVATGGSGPARVAAATTLPVPAAGTFGYQLYLGPIEHRRLAAIGHDLDDANPYGWILRPIIQPVSIFVVNILFWMHERLQLQYGWVLVIFGVLIRVALWPLNQKAMESGLRMQAVQPIIKEAQERYKKDPERMQKELMKIYKEHKVNPFGGCLPMLLPLPILFALFFVFANTIAFRGVPFLWMPDLSRHDPLYIVPVLMAGSMFVVSWVGQRNLPPNPQTKMMMWMMPIMMFVLFFRFASGLNLYYAVQNLVSIPQQYFVARARARKK